MKKKSYLSEILLVIFLILISCGNKTTPSAVQIIKDYDSVKFDYFFVEAVKLKVLGNVGEALKFFEQCLKINPESGAAYYQMAQIVMSSGDLNSGKKYLKQAINNEPLNIWYLLMLAGTYYQEAKLDSAILYYEKAAAHNPEKDDMLLTLARLYSENRKFDNALHIYNEFDKKYGINQSSTADGIKNLMWSGRYDEALEKAHLLLEQFPDEIVYNGLLAEIYRGKGDQEKAMEVYDKLMQRNPGNPETQLSLCDFLLTEKKYDDLFMLVNTVILNDLVTREDKLSLLASMIETQDILNDKSDALKLSLMIMEAEYENDHIVQLLRPELLSQEKNYREASARLEEVIREQPDNYFAWEKLLLVYLDAGETKKLEEKGRECATMFNRSFLAKILYATGASENENYETTLEELRKADILAGNDKKMKMQVLSIKADVLYKMKNYDEAFRTFEEAIKTDSEDITILNNYAYYLAELDLRLKEAEIMARKVIARERNNYTYLDTYGWVLYKRGKLKEAEKIFREILENSSDTDAEYFEHYGYILRKRNNCSKAISNWKQAIKADSSKTYLKKEIENCEKKH
ncbi:MAG: tetratricopeptide repeat protein [Bacteroidota bacterium]